MTLTSRVAALAVGALVALGGAACGGSDDTGSPEEASQDVGTAATAAEEEATTCSPLSQDEVAALVGENSANYKGEGPFTVTAALRAPVSSPNDFFTAVVYLQGDAPDAQGLVYVFATSTDDLRDPAGSVLGAEPATRDAWVWGEVAERGAPITTAARQAVADAEVCLP